MCGCGRVWMCVGVLGFVGACEVGCGCVCVGVGWCVGVSVCAWVGVCVGVCVWTFGRMYVGVCVGVDMCVYVVYLCACVCTPSYPEINTHAPYHL